MPLFRRTPYPVLTYTFLEPPPLANSYPSEA